MQAGADFVQGSKINPKVSPVAGGCSKFVIIKIHAVIPTDKALNIYCFKGM